jgi:hypothetical protein
MEECAAAGPVFQLDVLHRRNLDVVLRTSPFMTSMKRRACI